jgi:sialic acid synthase SpsE
MKSIKIGKRFISENDKPYFIADIGANHDGEIDRAFTLIELAKESGADAAKFQNFQAEKIVSKRGFEVLGGQLSHQASWGKPVFEVYKEASLPYEWTEKLKAKCDEVEIEYFTTPYDFESADQVYPYVNLYKIGSGDITWTAMIQYVAGKGKPVILSTGAAHMTDVRRAMNVLMQVDCDIILMQCNTNYTASAQNYKYINLNVLKTYKNIFPEVILGLSDHTIGHSTVLGGVALGAIIFEKHFTDDNTRIGPDHKFAMNPKTWREMVNAANDLHLALGDGNKVIEENEKDTVVVQRRALRYKSDYPAGHILRKNDLYPLRPIPVDGIAPYEIEKVLNRRLLRAVEYDEYVKLGDVEQC